MSTSTVLAFSVLLFAAVPAANAQSTTRASVTSAGCQSPSHSYDARITEDGRLVFFHAWEGIVPGSNPGGEDVVVHDRQTGATSLAIILPGGGLPNDITYFGSISRDGRFLSFVSYATNILPAANGVNAQVFLLDRNTSSFTLISVNNAGTRANDDCDIGEVSDDGRFVAFQSYATNLVPGDSNGNPDIFLRDRVAGTTRCLSVALNGLPSHTGSGYLPTISGDGRFVAFGSDASDLVSPDTNGVGTDVFVFDLLSGASTLITRNSAGVQSDGQGTRGEISRDGRFVVFENSGTNLVAGDTNACGDVFVRDLIAGITQRVSLSSTGVQADLASSNPHLSADGSQIAFTSDATNLVPGDTNALSDLFLRDMVTGSVERVSVTTSGAEAGQASNSPEIYSSHVSASGRYVAFSTYFENLVPGDSNGKVDVLVRDRLSTVPGVLSYCTAKLNSLGCTPSIGCAGEPRLTGYNAFFVSASHVRNNKPGLFLWSPNASSTPFGGGTLCVASPVTRGPSQLAGGNPTGNDCSGNYSFFFSQAYMASKSLSAGAVLRAQFWSRDQGFAAPNNIGLTDGIEFTLAP